MASERLNADGVALFLILHYRQLSSSVDTVGIEANKLILYITSYINEEL
jgi:hypothetical protein